MKKIHKLSIFLATTLIATCGINIKKNKDTADKYNNYMKKITNTIECDDDFLISAHRGFSSLEVENTKKAIKLAAKKDYIDYIEIDATLTKDNKIVLSHDNIIFNNNGIVKISSIPYDEATKEKFSYQSYYLSPYFFNDPEKQLIQKRKKRLNSKEYNLIGLKEGIEACKDKKVLLDIKFQNNKEEFTEELKQELQDVDTSNITFQSLDIESLKYFKENTGYDNCLALIRYKSDLKYIDDFDNIGLKSSLIKYDRIDELLDTKKEVAVWTINNSKDLDDVVNELDDLYDDVIYITDNPDLIATELYKKKKTRD